MQEGRTFNPEKIFISYAHKDYEIIKKYILYLKDNYFNFWYDNHLQIGDRFRNIIGEQIKSAKYFLAFYSSNYRNSAFCNDEFNIAESEKKIIISIKIEDCFRDENANTGLSNVQFISGVSRDESAVFNQLFSLIPGLMNCKKNLLLLQKYNIEDANYENKIIPFINYHNYNLDTLFLYLFDFLKSLKLQNAFASFNFEEIEVYSTPLQQNSKFLDSYFFRINDEKGNDNYKTAINRFIRELLLDHNHQIYQSFKPNEGNNQYIIDKLLANEYSKLDSLEAIFEYFSELRKAIGYLFNSNDSYQISKFTLDLLRKKQLEEIETTCEGSIVFPNLKSLSLGNEIVGGENNPLLSLINSLDESENGGYSQDLYLYGESGSGKIFLIKDFLLNYHNDAIYINLANINSKDPSIIHDFIQGSNYSSGGFNFDLKSLSEYALNHRLTIILYGVASLDERKLSGIIEEIKFLSYFSRVVILSRKRKIVSKIFLNGLKDELNGFAYYDVANYDIVTVKNIISNDLRIECNDDKLLSIINTPSKINYFIDSISGENGKIYTNKINNSSDLLYVYLFDDKSDSISNKCKKKIKDIVSERYYTTFFNQNIDSMFKLIAEWAYSCFIGIDLKIDEHSFNYLEDYNIMKNIDGKYYFTTNTYKEYFIAFHLANLLIKKAKSNEYSDIMFINNLKNFKNEYSILQFVGYCLDSESCQKEVYNYLLNIAKELVNPNEIASIVYLLILLSDNDFLYEIDFDNLLTYIDENTFRDSELFTEIIIPDSVLEIKRAAFVNLEKLTYIDFGGSVKKIAPWAIINCQLLEDIRFGKSLEEVTAPLITNCDSLVSIRVKKANPYFSSTYTQGLVSKDLKTYFFACQGLEKIEIPEETTTIKSWAFKGMKKMKSLFIPKNVLNIATDFTDECLELKEFIVDENNQKYHSLMSSMITYIDNKGRNVLFRLASGVTDKFVIPSSIEVIGDDAISTCRKLNSLYIPDSVSVIGDYALADLENTTLIEFEDMDSLEETGNFILMCHNPNLKIKDDNRYITPNGFVLNTRKNTNNAFKSDIFAFNAKLSFDSLIKNNNLFETYYENKEVLTGFDNVEIYRYVDLYRDKQVKINNYNILLLGMVEYNYFLGLPYENVFKEIDEILEKLAINCIILARDLPCPKEILIACQNRISIYRSTLGTSKISVLISEICKTSS